MALRRRPAVPHPSDPTLALVPLTRGYFAVVSAIDAELASRYLWVVKISNLTCYATRSSPLEREVSYLHRLVAEAAGMSLENEIDHINGNGLDCRRSNLRPATRREQMRNTGLKRSNKSGVSGVGWHSTQKRWRAFIGLEGKQKHLGTFRTFEEAVAARDAATSEYFGEFAVKFGRDRALCH